MTLARYILRSLSYFWRTHLGVALGALIAAAILTGSLSVGDSVRFSLRRLALSRLGAANVAVLPGEFFFRDKLAREIAAQTGARVAPLLRLRGTVALPDGSARANAVQVVGVDDRFWKMGGAPDLLAGGGAEGFVANEALAARLGLKPGQPVIVRIEEPSLLSRDAPLSGAADSSVAIRLRLHAIAGESQFGRFSLQANQVPPLTVFLPLSALQMQVKKSGRANLLLAERVGVEAANAALRQAWTLADLNLELRALTESPQEELRTDRVFMEPGIAAAALKAVPKAEGVLTYLVNEIRHGEHATPYSMVTATGAGLGEDEIAINAWLAEDLAAKPGDELTLRYYVVADNRQLVEQSKRFKVCAILPLERADSSWMPPFPGLADAENCRDWEPGIPMDMSRIRPKDEEYWKRYRGTPKAFISLQAGQAIWANRFGNLTSIRYPAKPDGIETALRREIDPVKSGLAFQPVREAALRAGDGAQDFGGLFVGFSFFLVIAALLLMAMLFVFSLEQRTPETGLLLALGFDRKRLRGLLLREGYLLVGLGTVLGVAAGALYARITLQALSTVWRSAVNLSAFQYHCEPATLGIGVIASLGVGMLATWLAGRSQARRPVAELLASGAELELGNSACRLGWSVGTGVASLAGAAGILLAGGRSADAFFGAGALLLISGLAFVRAWLVKLGRAGKLATGLAALGVRGASRRLGRSLTVVAVLASGVFIVVSVGAFREDPLAQAHERHSGTGGFALFGQSTLPIYEDLNSEAGRTAFGLTPESMQDVNVVPMRWSEGDDASCLNLNRAQQPRFLGLRPEALAARKAFHFKEVAPGASSEAGWAMLDQKQLDGAVPVIGDEATTRWGLGLAQVGDMLSCKDERGREFKARLVGVLGNSVLQGSLVMADAEFVARFPSSTGSRVLLVDAPVSKAAAVSATLTKALQRRGLELVPAWRRLAEFQAVESSYIAIFEALGGLGLLLGSAGLGIVVLRNVAERRNEFALMQAVGFSPRALRWMVFCEHGVLIALGTGVGGMAAAVAVLPSFLSSGGQASWAMPLATLVLLPLLGLAWSWFAAWAALRGPLLDALRSE